jgi:pentatricopeptide repeat protein
MGKEMHAEIGKRRSMKHSLLVGNALIDMYAKCGLLVEAREVFDVLRARDVISWTSLISGYVQQDRGEEAIECFEKMKEEKVRDALPNDVTFACVLKACGINGGLGKGKAIHSEVEQKGLVRTSQLVGNSLVDMYAKCGVLESAREVFESLVARDLVSWTVLITGYAQVGAITEVFLAFDRMIDEGTKPNAITFVSMLNACSQSGLIDIGLNCAGSMKHEYGLASSLEHHTCIVDILARAGQLDIAVGVMKRMPSYPNVALWLTVLGACKKWGNVELAREAFEQAVLLDEKEISAYVSMYNIYVEFGLQADADKVEAMRLDQAKADDAPVAMYLD